MKKYGTTKLGDTYKNGTPCRIQNKHYFPPFVLSTYEIICRLRNYLPLDYVTFNHNQR